MAIMMDLTASVARLFAECLDREDYAAVLDWLSDDCVYTIRDEVHRGPQAIVSSYRESGEWAAASFDRIRYESSVAVEGPRSAVITFIDHIEHCGAFLTHRSAQRVEIDGAGRIRRIDHQELPEEGQALDEFLERAGVKARGPSRA